MDQKPEIPEPQPHHDRGGHLAWFVWFFFSLFVVYPLSIGPAAWLHAKAPSIRPAIEAIYTPVTTLADHSAPFKDALQWYVTRVWRLP